MLKLENELIYYSTNISEDLYFDFQDDIYLKVWSNLVFARNIFESTRREIYNE